MGRAYSVNGYLNAVMRRSTKTLLVEGVSDKDVMHSLCVGRGSDNFVIDQAGLLGEDVSGLGNRERVKSIQVEAGAISSDFPRLMDLLSVLIDREWDDLEAGEGRLSQAWIPPQQGHGLYVTNGHSIENYSFRADHVHEFLKLNFSECLNLGVIRLIDELFPSMLVTAACLSLSVQESALLSKMSGDVVSPDYFYLKDGLFFVGESMIEKICSRNVDHVVASALVSRANSLVESHAAGLLGSDCLHWLPHGHVGEAVIWALVAFCARSAGVEQNVVYRIQVFDRKDRGRFMSYLLSELDPVEVRPLRDVADWLTA